MRVTDDAIMSQTQLNKQQETKLKATTPEYIRKQWPAKTEPEWCWFDCGNYIYFDSQILSKSCRRIPVEVTTGKKHQCPCNPDCSEYDKNHPTFTKPATITVDLDKVNKASQMVEPEDSDKRDKDDKEEEEE